MKERRRVLRKNETAPEARLWNVLRNRRFSGYKFRRQYSIGKYVVDFYSPLTKLIIEVDGPGHETVDAREYDKAREDEIKSLGIHIIRFKNEEVENSLGNVMKRIADKVREMATK